MQCLIQTYNTRSYMSVYLQPPLVGCKKHFECNLDNMFVQSFASVNLISAMLVPCLAKRRDSLCRSEK